MLWNGIVYENESYDLVYPQVKEKYRNRFDPDLFSLYRKLITLRHEHPAIRRKDDRYENKTGEKVKYYEGEKRTPA